MTRTKKNIFIGLILLTGSVFFAASISSCGKTAASAAGLNIKYEVLNLCPDMGPVNLFINFQQTNTLGDPFTFNVNPGYFYVPSVDTPYQIRSNLSAGTNLFSLDNVLKPNTVYSLFIVGNVGNRTDTTIFTVDTATAPALGRGKVRFINASPTGTAGLDLNANGTQVFSKTIYPNYTAYKELPVGNYDFQVNITGSSTVLKDLPGVTIQDGRLYTIYAYGYTNRIDSASFSAAVITNK
jgi:hypothetical protein